MLEQFLIKINKTNYKKKIFLLINYKKKYQSKQKKELNK